MKPAVTVKLWGTKIGYLGYAPGQNIAASFEYDPDFMKSGIQISPVHMTYPPSIHSYSSLKNKSFKGVPGVIADSLPDSYGNQLIDIYMAEKGVPPEQVSTLDRLLYVADRGMGALEYQPGESLSIQRSPLDIEKLTELSEMVLNNKKGLQKSLNNAEDRAAALSVIRVGSSAGGARSKALVALSSKEKLLDGTVSHGKNYSYWILKFDSSSNSDRDSKDQKGMPLVEYIYSQIAKDAGIHIPKTRLLESGDEKHFLIERFDRIIRNEKIDKLHYASWSGLAHADRDDENSYEQLILLLRKMKFGDEECREIYRRAVFNILGRNQDDHTKNTGFLMNRAGKWSLAPAFDLTYSYDPYGRWTQNHQCRLNGKNNDFELSDLLKFGSFCNLSGSESRNIIYQIRDAFEQFSNMAVKMGLSEEFRKTIEANLRLGIVE
ncbi:MULTISPECIES: type II toxin-antitoxin system HipA family toxin [unclassified Oceanispirochaeta]|uniref:type II toxin-antitoxin system HipA family toxin n=1 Tax=unclassified Oceanispirochaeta TaxID=2635722 RepID=UPI0018F78E11|nr:MULTISPECIES: type II toxin-antitoxin system HipA family toxin [unclassified Oceanispirochaeta]